MYMVLCPQELLSYQGFEGTCLGKQVKVKVENFLSRSASVKRHAAGAAWRFILAGLLKKFPTLTLTCLPRQVPSKPW